MQTFLPYPDYTASAQTLDRMRLGKQRVETLQILKTLTGASSGWSTHPAVRMWEGYEDALLAYGLTVCKVWTDKGYKDTCADKMRNLHTPATGASSLALPPWHGHEPFHLSHRSNLVRKLPAHYAPQFPGVPDDLPYLWPSATGTYHDKIAV